MTRVVVLADTHMRPGARRLLPGPVREALASTDAILHAGDVVTADLLRDLERLAPVHAVRGNNDTDASLAHLPATLQLELEGVRVAMIHDSGPAQGREGRLHRLFPEADVVVFGHSHIPWDEPGIDGQLLFNPGSPTERRSQPYRTFGVLELDGGRVAAHRVVPVA